MKQYTDMRISSHEFIRTFSPNELNDECTWHRDKRNRIVVILEGVGWQFQNDGKLPVRLQPGDTFRINALDWHRILPGRDELSLLIREF